MVYFIVTSLGEMSAYLPVPGAFTTFGARFVDPALGFSLGWNYWLQWAISIREWFYFLCRLMPGSYRSYIDIDNWRFKTSN
jgi:amino acid permease